MSRRSGGRDVYEIDTYERDTYDRRGNYDHVFEEDVEAHLRRRPHAPEVPQVREIERVRTRRHSPPEFLRESHLRSSSAGPLMRRPRVRDEHYEFIEHEDEREHDHRRSGLRPAHQRPTFVERKFSPPPPLARGVERDELVVRRERSRPPPPRESEFLVRREKDHGPEKRPARRYGRDWEWERERETEGEMERGRLERDYRKGSYVRERSHIRGDTEDIIIQRHEMEGIGGRGREEVIIKRREESSSSSESSSHGQINPPPIRAPPIHQEMITHHRHVDHGYEVVRPRPPQSEASARRLDDIEIRRRREHDGRSYEDEIIIDRESSHHRGRENFPPAHSPPRSRAGPRYGDRDESEIVISHRTSGGRSRDSERHRDRDLVVMRDREGSTRGHREAANIREEADYYNRLAHEGGHIGEAYNGATKRWSIVDVPPGTKRVELEGVGGSSQEITWQRYNGVRRSKFFVDGDEYASDREHTRDRGRIGKRYVGVKDKRDGLWTEITKDLVVKEAIERAGYDYEETQYFYYIFAYLKYDDIANLVALSEDFRQVRRERIREIQRERTRMITPPPLPAPAPPPPPVPLLLERPDYDEERIIEHEIFVDADKVPPPPLRVRRW
ncbi:hypothetical protein AJ78_00688 [Emergomyces pasteurianus Ep9510]|uniref:DUF8035 domain-containing protein n=1 Tax=Emergomyces pasteurianus Ep9510 TaxID=1447872 RepID=A0A1J9PSD1_9EURO|nr:hypothetical protein AJ78_00688 [Emergomyces pasteurianus Ep9510]